MLRLWLKKMPTTLRTALGLITATTNITYHCSETKRKKQKFYVKKTPGTW